jgi:hypothetical protein
LEYVANIAVSAADRLAKEQWKAQYGLLRNPAY